MQLESQMGLHFDPVGSKEGGYHVTYGNYWKQFESSWYAMKPQNRLLVEAGFHFLQECEHNTGSTDEELEELLSAAFVVREMVESSLYHLS